MKSNEGAGWMVRTLVSKSFRKSVNSSGKEKEGRVSIFKLVMSECSMLLVKERIEMLKYNFLI